FDDLIGFVSFSSLQAFFGTPIFADSLPEITDEILSPTLSKGEEGAIRRILVVFVDGILGE
ncbi:hypothetical protein, partial [Flavobacterium sp.]|uniref:hypothetical protein n=1 Tax=Flavobacterium sp. TaxID=239 RepID=UPI00379E3B8F